MKGRLFAWVNLPFYYTVVSLDSVLMIADMVDVRTGGVIEFQSGLYVFIKPPGVQHLADGGV